MIKNFEEVKQQLRELAEIVNSYKSEAVQLRVIELVLTANSGSVSGDEGPSADKARTKRRGTARAVETREPGAGGRSAKKLGGKALLSRLYDEGFFKGATRTIASIVAHADSNLATKVKQSDLSGPLAQYIRDGKLKRSKNAESQYEYSQAQTLS